MKSHYDLLIIGGGMVGASLAVSLLGFAKDLRLSVGLIEAVAMPESLRDQNEISKAGNNLPVYQPSYDSRSTALSYGTRKLYERMGVWDTVSEHLSSIEKIHVSDKGHFGATRLDASEEGVEALGYVVENHWLGNSLLHYIQQHPNVTYIDFICPAEVKTVTTTDDVSSVQVEFDGELSSVTADLLVLADGGRSGLREQLGIGTRQKLYEQHAVVANISPDRPHQHVAYERFTPNGPLALLPLSDQDEEPRFGLIWTVPEDDLERILGLSDRAFLSEVQSNIGYRVGRLIKVGDRAHYPLKRIVAEEQVRQNLVVLGNAAHALHPIAGQGYNLALRGVVDLAQHIIDAKRSGERLGAYENLLKYQKKREFDQQRTIVLSEQMMQLFSNSNSLLAAGRDLGLQLLDVCSPAKTLFARGAMGIDIPPPELK